MDKRFVLITIFFCPILFEGSGNAPNPNLDTLQAEPVSGVYFLHGTIIEYIPSDEDPVQKKNSQGFNMLIQETDENQIRIYGLVGADAGRAENVVFPACNNPENCKVFGTKTEDYEWEIDIKNGARTYHAIIKLKMMINLNEFTLEGTYEYQNKRIEYKMDGRRIPE